MNQADLQAMIVMIAKAVHNEDNFGKVWGVVGPFVSGILVGLIALGGQLYTSYSQRKHERESSTEDSEEKTQRAESELMMWNIASQRKATSKVAQMRQVWINNLRKDMAKYLTLQQELMYRWDAMVSQATATDLSVEEKAELFKKFRLVLPKLRQEALELKLRIVLYLNPSEDETKELVKLMSSLEGTVLLFDRTISQINPQNIRLTFQVNHAAAVTAVQVILSNEWKVVKRELGVDSGVELTN